MPQGPGTYGSKRGRPPTKKNKNIKKMGKPTKKKKLPKRGQRASANKKRK